jgi:hypothetical protein
MLWLFTGSSNTDDDYGRYVASFAIADEACMRGPQPGIGILVVDDGNPVPNAAWRKKMAEASTTLKSNPIVILAAASSVMRGIATAINWIRPPPYEFFATSTFDEAVALAQKRRGEPLTGLHVLLDEARAEAAKGGTKRA